jgi:membrane protein DedA with SNARE-associated domain
VGSDFISQIPHEWYWLFLFVSVIIENIFPPYPGDTVVVFAGYIAGAGYLKFSHLVIAIITGNLLSAAMMYYFGLEVIDFMAKRIKNENLKKVFSREGLESTHKWFEKYGFWAVVFSRFSAGIRFFVAIIAGMIRMHITLFLFAFFIATILWNSILVYGGYVLGKNWSQLLGYIELYSGLVAVVIVIALLFFGIRYYLKNKK